MRDRTAVVLYIIIHHTPKMVMRGFLRTRAYNYLDAMERRNRRGRTGVIYNTSRRMHGIFGERKRVYNWGLIV